MEEVKAYLLSVTTAAILCGCINSLINKQRNAVMIKVLCGIFLSLAVLKPVVEVGIPDISQFISDIETSKVASVIEDGRDNGKLIRMEIIKRQTEEYILNKASSMSCDLNVSVKLNEQEPFEPIGVSVSGYISPNAKVQLSEWICDTLSIQKEDQDWIG